MKCIPNGCIFAGMGKVREQGGYKFMNSEDGTLQIFDPIRQKFVVNTPEEWVRQNTIKYLLETLGYPRGLIAIEKSFQLYRRVKRTDITVYDMDGNPLILVECKRPSIRITQQTFDQAFRYNMVLKFPYILITNGEELYCCHMEGETATFIKDIPSFQTVESNHEK